MASASMHRRRGIALAAGFSAAALVLAGCAAGGGDEDSSAGGGTLTIGTTDKVTTLDPAGSYDTAPSR